MATDAREQVFRVRLDSGEHIKLTAKPKALDKPFGKTIVAPFLKWWNAKHEDDEEHAELTSDDLEVVRLASSPVDLSMSVRAIISAATSSAEQGSDVLPVDVLRRKERLVCFTLAGIELPMTISAKFVHAPLSLYAFPEFLRTVNGQYGVEILPREVAQVRFARDGPPAVPAAAATAAAASDGGGVANEAAQVDLSAPAFKVLSREGQTRIDVILTPDVARRVKPNIPQLSTEYEAPNKGEPGVFRVRCGDVELKMTIPPKALAKPLSECLCTPFLKEYARKTGTIAEASALTRVTVDGLETSAEMLASSFVLGNEVRVDLVLDPKATKSLWDDDDEEEEAPKPKPMEVPPDVAAEIAKHRQKNGSRYAQFLGY
jgi:hypothetical protein